MTSEAQTIELGLKSPGLVHSARVGRDFSVFDLGAKVYEKIKTPGKGNGRDFVEKILEQRAQFFPPHPVATPSQILGDIPLETIAAENWKIFQEFRTTQEYLPGNPLRLHTCVLVTSAT